MLLDINLLKNINSFAKMHSLSRQHVYRLAAKNEITLVKIDGAAFVYMDEKTRGFERKRRERR